MAHHRGIVCTVCGSPVEERRDPNNSWVTVCIRDSSHNGHMTQVAWRNRPKRTMQDAIDEAMIDEIFTHLPLEFQAAIKEKEKQECQSKD